MTKTTSAVDVYDQRLACVVRNCARFQIGVPGRPLWAKVADITGFGKTSATELCIRSGMDPEIVLPSRYVESTHERDRRERS